MAIRSDPERFEILALDSLMPNFGGRRVFEIGCGDGRLTRRYADRAASVLAIDPDAVAIAAFRQDMPPGRVEVRAIGFDDDELVLPDRLLDVIIFSWSL